MVLKKTIEDYAYFMFRKAQFEAMHTERLGIIHVSDIIKECPRMVYYGKFTEKQTSTKDIKSLWFGQIVHTCTNMSTDPKDNEMFFAWDFIEDKSYTLDEAKAILKQNPDKQYDILFGSADDILTIDGEDFIVDKKTTGNMETYSLKKGEAYQNHKDQINVYRLLFNKCYGRDAKKGCNVYISNGVDRELRVDVIPCAYNLRPLDEMEKEVVEKCKSLRVKLMVKKLPDAVKNNSCFEFCPHVERCVNNENI